MDSQHGKARRQQHGRGFGLATAAKPSIILPGAFLFLQDLQEKKRADKRTRTAGLISLRVIRSCRAVALPALRKTRSQNTHDPFGTILLPLTLPLMGGCPPGFIGI